MAIIDAPSWDINGEKVFAYLYPEKNLSSNAVLNVTHSQEAIFLVDGKIQKFTRKDDIRWTRQTFPYSANYSEYPSEGKTR